MLYSTAAGRAASARSGLTSALLLVSISSAVIACGPPHNPKPVPQNRDGETLVPEKTQRSSEERYGAQQNSMNSLSMTPSEQAGMQHENATRPAENVDREKK